MAVSATRSVSIPSWINGENVLAAFRGLYINGYWEYLIKCDNNVNQKPISTGFRAGWETSWVGFNLFSSFSRIESKLSPERVTPYAWGFFPNPRGPYFYTALLLTVLNAVKIFKELKANQPPPVEGKNKPSQAPAHVPTGMDKFVVVVWKATPYLMIITNIAVTIFQLHQGDSSAWIQLVLTGITLIDITSWKPVEYRQYLNTILGYPINAAALYYGNAGIRLGIIFNWALRQVNAAALYYGNAGIRLGIIFNWALRQEIVKQKIQETSAKLQRELQSYSMIRKLVDRTAFSLRDILQGEKQC